MSSLPDPSLKSIKRRLLDSIKDVSHFMSSSQAPMFKAEFKTIRDSLMTLRKFAAQPSK
jgi:hypothetical protein